LHKQINIAGIIYNHCIAFHKRFSSRLWTAPQTHTRVLPDKDREIELLDRSGNIAVGFDFGLHYGLFIYLLITVISLNKRVKFLEKQIKNNKN